jgi:hypothetical protein
MQRNDLDVISWLRESAQPAFSKNFLDEYYQTVNPRVIFLKNLQLDSRIVDLGAGQGESAISREWPYFKRPPDLRLVGSKETFAGDFEEVIPTCSVSQFEAIICAHFVEQYSRFWARNSPGWPTILLSVGGLI